MTNVDFIDLNLANENIDLRSDPVFKIKLLESDLEEELKLEIEGVSINNAVINAIRRTIMRDIPVYAFYRTNTFVDVKKTRTMYNNDMIYNQIETLPIYDIMNDFTLENPALYLPTDIMKSIFSNFLSPAQLDIDDPELIEETNKLANIELTISYKNRTGVTMHLTTHHVVLKVNGIESDSYKKRDPISILALKADEEISLRAVANLGISKINGIYDASTPVTFNEIKPDKYVMWYETLGQIDKNLIFLKACNIIEQKLYLLKKFIRSTHEERPTNEIVNILLEGEGATLGNLIATTLQISKHIKTAGFSLPHVTQENVMLTYLNYPDSELKPIETLIQCIDYQIKLFKMMRDKFKNIINE